jgi:rhodanese-related sulfurtransferase
MGIRDYFRSVETMTPQQVRELMDRYKPDEYNLVDVRQPGEYRQGHLPGARLIPMAELSGRMAELDPSKPTITY